MVLGHVLVSPLLHYPHEATLANLQLCVRWCILLFSLALPLGIQFVKVLLDVVALQLRHIRRG